MGLDMKKLRSMQKEIKTRSEGGGGMFLYSGELTEELDVRILPPKSNMNGVYLIEEEGWWINGKFTVIDSSTDVIHSEVNKAKKSGDPDLMALIDKKNNGMPAVKKEVRYLIPLLVLDTEYNESTDEMEKCNVEGQKILVAKPTLAREINRVVTARPFQNGTEDGIADRVKGFNLIIGKQGKGLDTEYTAMGWNEPMEMDEKWYKELPDILEIHKKSQKSDEYSRSIIRNYLYGEEIIDDKPTEETTESKLKHKRPSKLTSDDKTEPKTSKDNEEKEAEPKQTEKVRSILDDAAADMEDMD